MTKDKIYESVLNRLLREIDSVNLGDVQFSPQRIDGARKDEPNTEVENKLMDDLRMWIMDNTSVGDPQNLRKTLIELMQSPKYGKFFQPPQSNRPIYRGLYNISRETLGSWLKSCGADITGPRGLKQCKFILRSLSGGPESWTYSRQTAFDFAQLGKKKGFYSVVVTAQPVDNLGAFMDLSEIQKKVSFLDFGIDKEEEVLSLLPIKVSDVMWVMK